MNNSASASRRTWNRVMNALVRASAVLVIALVAGILAWCWCAASRTSAGNS